jgi:hypothetical protein
MGASGSPGHKRAIASIQESLGGMLSPAFQRLWFSLESGLDASAGGSEEESFLGRSAPPSGFPFLDD